MMCMATWGLSTRKGPEIVQSGALTVSEWTGEVESGHEEEEIKARDCVFALWPVKIPASRRQS